MQISVQYVRYWNEGHTNEQWWCVFMNSGLQTYNLVDLLAHIYITNAHKYAQLSPKSTVDASPHNACIDNEYAVAA